MGSPVPPDTRFPHNGRLDGWKDIALYLGRGVRTAQRWERELGLPVHRLRTGAGEVVHADRAEIDAWLRRQSDASLAPEESGADATAADSGGRVANGRGAGGSDATAADGNGRDAAGPAVHPWRATAVVAGLIAIAALAVAGWAITGRAGWRGVAPQSAIAEPGPSSAPPSTGTPTSDTVAARATASQGAPDAGAQPVALAPAGDTLVAFDATGRQVWQHPFSAPIAEYNPQQPALFRRAWDILDIEGDGSNEAIFARANPSDPRVYGFNRDGSIRFAESIDTPVRFGEYACPPVMFTHVFREQRPDFPGTFLAAAHHPTHFPGVLRRLDAQGRAAGEYWSNGYITLAASVQIGGRWATLVGAAHNETGGASLAVFFDNIGGSAPATNPDYRCEGCEAGGPDILLVFPRSHLQQALGENATINSISLVGPDRLTVSVVIAGVPESDRHCCGQSYYTLDRDFRVVGTDLGGSYASLQQAIEAEHRVSAATRFQAPADFYPVRRWTAPRSTGPGGTGPAAGGSRRAASGWEVVRGLERPRPAPAQ